MRTNLAAECRSIGGGRSSARRRKLAKHARTNLPGSRRVRAPVTGNRVAGSRQLGGQTAGAAAAHN